jgi:quinohemoprotein ethanol dehydrogenase
VQYVAVLAGWGGAGLLSGTLAAQHGWQYKAHPRRLYSFALGATQRMPLSPPPAPAVPVDDPGFALEPAKVEQGKVTYSHMCVMCHGGGAVSGGSAPDLRASPIPLSRDGFKQVVIEGARIPKGMPRFPISDAELDGLQSYIRSRARETLLPASRE